VKIAELEGGRRRKRARCEASGKRRAQVRVLQAKAESDSMQYTLPLKQKQIEQSKTGSGKRARKRLCKNAEAACARPRVIDSKAEIERPAKILPMRRLNRISCYPRDGGSESHSGYGLPRISERMKFEAAVLKQNPMLIQKIIAERLSDKLQIMMVPVDGKNFFANDVFRSAFSGVPSAAGDEDADGNTSAANVNGQKAGQSQAVTVAAAHDEEGFLASLGMTGFG